MKKTRKIGRFTVGVHNLRDRNEYKGVYVFQSAEGVITLFTTNVIKKGDVLVQGKTEVRVAAIQDCRSVLTQYREVWGEDFKFYQLKVM